MNERRRSFVLTPELLRAYSRRGNFHSDAEAARAIGMSGLVAQGMQVAGPAYGLLLDLWGDDFVARGVVDLKFVGMVVAGQAVEAAVELDGDDAAIQVTNTMTGDVTVVGRASRGATRVATRE